MANKGISSKSLFHFTGGLKPLKNIIKTHSLWVSYCTEYYWNGYKFALPMACFCDIPLSQIGDHMSKYGSFGIGIKASWPESKKLSSVIYTRSNSELTHQVNHWLEVLYEKDGNVPLSDGELYLLSHVKKYKGRFVPKAKTKEKDKKEKEDEDKDKNSQMKMFYQEREWRYVPPNLKVNQIKVEKNDNVPIDVDDERKESLFFDYSDISYIIVENDVDREDIINFIGKINFENDKEKYLLMSKVLTSIQIENDF